MSNDTFIPEKLHLIEIDIKIEDATKIAYEEFWNIRYKQYLESGIAPFQDFTLPKWERVPEQAQYAWKRAIAKVIQLTLKQVVEGK